MREPQAHLTYRGDVRATFDDQVAKGPDYNGQWWWPVDAVYDEATDRTRVGFTKVPPEGGGGE